MIRTILIFVLIFYSIPGISQTTDTIPGDNKNISDNNDETIYTVVDSIATFPGGRNAWNKFIENNLNALVGVENGAKRGTYNVKIKITVTKDGTLKDFVPMTKFKHGFEEEAIRVLKMSPKWIPAKKNGKIVNSSLEQIQTFIII